MTVIGEIVSLLRLILPASNDTIETKNACNVLEQATEINSHVSRKTIKRVDVHGK